MNTSQLNNSELKSLIVSKKSELKRLESGFSISFSMRKASEISYLRRELNRLVDEDKFRDSLEGLSESEIEDKKRERLLNSIRGLRPLFESMNTYNN